MNENDFLSLCKGNVQYCSVEQQEESLERSPRHYISLTTITYIHFFVQSGPHGAAVQITINPFSLENYPKQTFFHANYRYSLCCGKAPQDTVAITVKERVQKVYDAFDPPCYWDFSHDQYGTVDPVHKISTESCLQATNSKLCKYIQSAHVDVPTYEDLVSSPAAHGTGKPSSSGYGPRSNRVNRTRSHRTCTDENPLPANENYDANDVQLIQSTTQANSDRNDIHIQILVEAAATKIRKGLNNLQSTSTLPQLSTNFESLYDKAKYFEEDLWAQASRAEAIFKGVTWSSRFLASCFRIIRLKLRIEDRANDQRTTDSKNKKDDQRRKEWQIAAETINSIVNCLLKTWDWKAFLIYPALESTGFYFNYPSRLGRENRQKFVSSLTNILRNEVPNVSGSGPQVLLDPAYFVSCALDLDYKTVCTALKLDAASTVEITAEKLCWGSYSSFDGLTAGYKLLPEGAFPKKRKSGAESESTPHQIKRLATSAFSSGSIHGCEKTPVSNPEDHQFPQDAVLLLPSPHSPLSGREPTIDTNPTGSNHNSIPIDTLLNAVDYIAGSPQSQQLSTTGNSSIQIASGAILSGHQQAEIGSSRWDTRVLESQAESESPPSNRRRVDTIPSPDSSFPQPSSRTIQSEHNEMLLVRGAEAEKLENVLGTNFFEWINESHMRKRETGQAKFTDAVRLYVSNIVGVDSILEVWLGSSHWSTLLQAKAGSVEDSRNILGDYLFEAMETSNWRMEEKRQGVSRNTGAFKIFCYDSDGGSDFKMEVILSYWTGMDIWQNMFPVLD